MCTEVHGQNISDCVTREDLAGLFDDAFATWRSCARDPAGSRQTPRIPAGDTKPLFVVSCTHNGKELKLGRRADISDISADGLGITLAEPLPVGATLCFAFDSKNGRRNYGIASVARVNRQTDGHRIGLTFAEKAESLETDQSRGEDPERSSAYGGWRRVFDRVKRAANGACRILVQGRPARKQVERRFDGKDATFVVEARLFRYTAALFVEGRKLVAQSGALRDRLLNLLCYPGRPTMINLEGGGFSAWATLRANAVTRCDLDLSLQTKHSMCMRALQGVSLPPGPRDRA